MKKNIFLIATLLFLQSFSIAISAKEKGREYYQITIYHFADSLQEQAINSYLKNAYLPALHRMSSAKIGVFKPIANDTAADKLIFVIAPFSKPETLVSLSAQLQKDQQFLASSKYFDTSYQNPPYLRMENIVLQAFPLAPKMNLPKLSGSVKDKVYELRSYESPTVKIYRNKVQMFNEGGETNIFSRLQFNPVFYAEVIAGSHMPNLMYMTSFENQAARDAHWKAFGDDPEWKKLSALPEYQHNVSKINIWFLHATDYSDY
jgi:hypothetical protein